MYFRRVSSILLILFISTFSIASAAPVLRSSSSTDQPGGVSATSGTLSGVQAGDMLTIVLRERDGSSPVSISDSVNGSWNLNNSVVSNSFSGITNSRIYYLPNSQAGNPTITITFSVSSIFSFYADAWGGVSASNPLYTSSTNINSSGTLHSHGSVTTSGETLILTSLGSGSADPVVSAPASGFNLSNSLSRNIRQYRISPATETTTATLTTSNSLPTNGAIAVFLASGSVVTPPPPTPTPPPPTPTPTPTPTPPPPPTPTPPPPSGSPRTLYVNNNIACSDSTQISSNSSTNPWCTLGRAMWGSTNRSTPNSSQAAAAGDTVIVNAGTYSAPGTGIRYEPAFNPVNSGASGSPITIQANGTVNLTLSSGSGPVMGAYNKNYIIWRGFTINESSAPSIVDTGPVVLWSTNGSVIENSTIIGNTSILPADNHPGIRFEGAMNSVARNNTISGFRCSVVNSANGNGIQVYLSGNLIIENNTISNSGSGIFLKAPAHEGIFSNMGYYTIRNNLITNVETGIITHRNPSSVSSPTKVYQNVIRDSDVAFKIWGFGDNTDPTNAKFVNNTIHNVQQGIWVYGHMATNANNIFWNNIITNSSMYVFDFETDPSFLVQSIMDLQHNVYNNISGRYGMVNYVNYTALSNLRAVYPWLEISSPSTVITDPMYVNVSSNDYRLQSGSPARTLGVDYLDLNNNGSTTDIIPAGAYITGNEVIGVNTGGVSPSPTPTPTPTPPPPTPTPLAGDLNVDHVINSLDWSIMNSQWFTSNSQSDLRVDGQVNSLDFAILSSNWGRTW